MAPAPHLSFMIPIRHPDNSRDWGLERANLARTAKSIAAQRAPGWQAVVAANHGADLPPLPEGFHVARVDLPPNPGHDLIRSDKDRAIALVRRDKGLRIAAALRRAAQTAAPGGHVMFVDGDDLVSNRLSEFVRAHPGAPGWRLERGWCFDLDERFAIPTPGRFDKLCGSSHLLRADLLALPTPEDPGYLDRVSRLLGAHRLTSEILEAEGHALAPLPFPGAAYLVGHRNAHSLSRGLFAQFFLHGAWLRRPLATLAKLKQVRRLDADFRREFMGEA